MTAASPFNGRRVLVVEDDYLLALDMRRTLEAAGATVVGPVPNPQAALDLLARDVAIDFSVLDLNLGGERGYPVADALTERGVPFALTTGYDISSIPPRYAAAPCCQKPVSLPELERAFAQAAAASKGGAA